MALLCSLLSILEMAGVVLCLFRLARVHANFRRAAKWQIISFGFSFITGFLGGVFQDNRNYQMLYSLFGLLMSVLLYALSRILMYHSFEELTQQKTPKLTAGWRKLGLLVLIICCFRLFTGNSVAMIMMSSDTYNWFASAAELSFRITKIIEAVLLYLTIFAVKKR